MKKLKEKLLVIDGKSYRDYKSIKGLYKFDDFDLEIVYVQGDPFAAPSSIKIKINLSKYGYENELYNNYSRKTAFEDYFGRKIYSSIKINSKGRRGTGKSGEILIYKNQQEIIKRSSVEIENNFINIRFYLGLPANGRKVLSKEANIMFFKEIPEIFEILKKNNINFEKLKKHIEVNEEADMLRKEIEKEEIISFIANGSILARQSGIDDKALKGAVTFQSPKELEVEIILANGKKIKGMGIKKGVNIITGGGFHGKSTLLNAIEKGVYNHIAGDGREYVVSDYNSVKIRAEDGRSISNVDISPFINNLPLKKDTKNFFSKNASGSTSQAANIIEAIELGAKVLLIDEDTSATNFMMRDAKIQKLIKKEKEPISPFIDRIRAMYEKMGISSIVVVGGLGDYFDVADKVIILDEYQVFDVTEKAKEISKSFNLYGKNKELDGKEFEVKKRTLNTQKGMKFFEKKDKIRTNAQDDIVLGDENINLRNVEQIVENGQTVFIGELIRTLIKNNKEKIIISEELDKIENLIMNKNISEILKIESGNMSFARKYETASAINRIREDIF